MRGGGGRGGTGGQCYKESGLSELYILANSLLCLKSSGDRISSNTVAVKQMKEDGSRSSSGSGSGRVSHIDGDVVPLTLLDDKHPQLIYPINDRDRNHRDEPFNNIIDNHQLGGYNPCVYNKNELHVIRSIALSGHAMPLLVHSLCPSIFGHDLVKLGLLLGIFGGNLR